MIIIENLNPLTKSENINILLKVWDIKIILI